MTTRRNSIGTVGTCPDTGLLSLGYMQAPIDLFENENKGKWGKRNTNGDSIIVCFSSKRLNDLPRALDLTVNFKHPCVSSVVKFYPLKKWIGCDHIVVVIILGLDLTVASCQIYTMNFKWQCVSSV